MLKKSCGNCDVVEDFLCKNNERVIFRFQYSPEGKLLVNQNKKVVDVNFKIYGQKSVYLYNNKQQP